MVTNCEKPECLILFHDPKGTLASILLGIHVSHCHLAKIGMTCWIGLADCPCRRNGCCDLKWACLG